MIQNIVFVAACVFAYAVHGACGAISIDGFTPVHKAKVVREGANCVRVKFSSAEWGTGIKWESPDGADMSGARWLAVDVENLSRTRQARLTMHLSAGGVHGDSGDHATAILRKNRSINTGIGLNPGSSRDACGIR